MIRIVEHAAPRAPMPPVGAITRGTAENGVSLRVEDGLLQISIHGDPPAGGLVDCFREAFATGTVAESMPVLVDLTRFSGRVDWPSIRAIGDLTPWGHDRSRSPRVAYLSDSPWFGALLKVAAALYPRTAHRRFDDASTARDWLRADLRHGTSRGT